MSTAREVAREDLTRRIVEAGRRQLGEVGAAGLSVRAVARELGLVSSAVYRYVADRDELLTRLIVTAFTEFGAAGEAELGPPPADAAGEVERWRRVCRALRTWALAHPHEFTLVYGTPVPDYAAPAETAGAAERPGAALGTVLREAVQREPLDPNDYRGLPATLDEELRALARIPAFGLADLLDGVAGSPGERPLLAAVGAGLAAWQQLCGSLTLELNGHLDGVIADRDLWFDHLVDLWGRSVLPRSYRQAG
ncbi:TetR/AcrR family transcriptional regulator [Kineococcus gynurae]|uniref:TetR/AcrR family transcriptional regulator n=1 Tax=Kineococcus gynurae TaxID=452979 RepID=A0ABV5LQ37_9ACTN